MDLYLVNLKMKLFVGSQAVEMITICDNTCVISFC